MGRRLARCFDHLVHDVLGRGAVRVAHAEVDNVFSPRPGRSLQSRR